MMIFWSVTVLTRGLDTFLLFESTRNFYVILLESFNDSKEFLAIVMYICYFFAFVYSVIDIGNENDANLFERGMIVF